MLCQKEKKRMGKPIQDVVYVKHNLPTMVQKPDTHTSKYNVKLPRVSQDSFLKVQITKPEFSGKKAQHLLKTDISHQSTTLLSLTFSGKRSQSYKIRQIKSQPKTKTEQNRTKQNNPNPKPQKTTLSSWFLCKYKAFCEPWEFSPQMWKWFPETNQNAGRDWFVSFK